MEAMDGDCELPWVLTTPLWAGPWPWDRRPTYARFSPIGDVQPPFDNVPIRLECSMESGLCAPGLTAPASGSDIEHSVTGSLKRADKRWTAELDVLGSRETTVLSLDENDDGYAVCRGRWRFEAELLLGEDDLRRPEVLDGPGCDVSLDEAGAPGDGASWLYLANTTTATLTVEARTPGSGGPTELYRVVPGAALVLEVPGGTKARASYEGVGGCAGGATLSAGEWAMIVGG